MAKPQDKIPEGYNAWCQLCNKPFRFFEGLAKHNRENVDEHKKRSGLKQRKERKDATKPTPTN